MEYKSDHADDYISIFSYSSFAIWYYFKTILMQLVGTLINVILVVTL